MFYSENILPIQNTVLYNGTYICTDHVTAIF